MKEYIKPTIKIKEIESIGVICMSMHNEEGDGEQLANQTYFDDDENTFDNKHFNVWE